MSRHRLAFRQRETPLEPRGLLARGSSLSLLVQRLLERTDDELSRLSGVRGTDLIVLTGERDALPWCDGVRYFGAVPEFPGVLLPVDLEPDLPMVWLSRALPGSGTRLLLPTEAGLQVIPLLEARPIARSRLLQGP